MTVTADDIKALADWDPKAEPDREIAFRPSRVLLQDFTGVPAIVDLAAMRDAMKRLGGDPKKINPLQPVELVIDHSVQVDEAGTPQAFAANAELEFQRNRERYAFLRWGQNAFENFRVVPPDTGIVHQVNLEYLARVVFAAEAGERQARLAYPDTLVGTDSHTTMINGLGVLGWGVGGIEAEAAMLGQPVSMLVPQVVGFKLTGTLPRRGDGHRPGADRHPDAAEEGRGRQVRRVLRRRPGRPAAGRPGHDRQHGPRVWRDLRAVPDRRRDDPLPRALRAGPPALIRLVEAYAKAQGMFHTAELAGGRVFRHARARPLDRRAQPGRPAAPAGPGAAARRQDVVPDRPQGAAVAAGPPRKRRRRSLPVIERFASEGGGTAVGVAEPGRRTSTPTAPRRSPTARS